jgi:hypothetical protein
MEHGFSYTETEIPQIYRLGNPNHRAYMEPMKRGTAAQIAREKQSEQREQEERLHQLAMESNVSGGGRNNNFKNSRHQQPCRLLLLRRTPPPRLKLTSTIPPHNARKSLQRYQYNPGPLYRRIFQTINGVTEVLHFNDLVESFLIRNVNNGANNPAPIDTQAASIPFAAPSQGPAMVAEILNPSYQQQEEHEPAKKRIRKTGDNETLSSISC